MWKVMLALFLLVADPSRADAANVFAEGGVGIVSERGVRVPFIGFGALAPIGDVFSLGARLRLHRTPRYVGGDMSTVLLAAARLRVPVAGLDAWVGLGAGIGSWNTCLGGDVCGGGGPAADAEVGLDLPIVSVIKVALAVDLLMQTGYFYGADRIWVPSLSLGVGL